MWRAVAVFGPAVLLLGIYAGSQIIEGRSEPVTQPCMSAEDREYTRALLLKAIDQALVQHTAHMYEVWMKDNRDQPQRASVGVNAGVAAYVKAKGGANSWRPPEC
jgi:hypothetical protein